MPGSTLPTLRAQLPSSSLAPPGSSSSKPASAPSIPSPGSDYPPPQQPIKDRVVPEGYGPDTSGGHAPDALNSVLLNGLSGETAVSGGRSGAGALAGVPVPTQGARPIDLAGIKAPAGLPALLAIIAIVALSLVTAMYARLYLMRRRPTDRSHLPLFDPGTVAPPAR
jgi:hypothetical protein